MEGQGFHFPKIPDVNPADIKPIIRDSNIGTVQEIETEENESDLENYFDNAVFKYKGKELTIQGKKELIPLEGPDVPEQYQPTRFDSDVEL